MHKLLTSAGLAVLMAAAPAHGEDFKTGSITISNAWARPTIGMVKTGAGYITITNNGAEPDRLVAIEAPGVSQKAELHTHIQEGDIMRMRVVPAIDIPAGGTVAMEPGGFHVMFMQLKDRLAKDGHFQATLDFEKAGKVPVEFTVADKPGAMSGGGGHMHMPMGGKK